MVLSITSNASADISQRNLQLTERRLNRSFTRISSGQRVFSAREDAASLAIGTALRLDSAGLNAAQTNASTGISMLQVADGSLGQIADILSRMGSLASSAQNEALSNTERGFLDVEYQRLLDEITRISAQTQFNGQPLLGGASDVSILTQGANVDAASGFTAYEFNPNKVDDLDQFTVEFDPAINIMRVTNTTQGRFQDMIVPSAPSPGFTSTFNFSDLGVKITLSSAFNDAAGIGNPPIGVLPGPNPVTDGFDVQATATAAPATLEFQIGRGTDPSDRIQISLPLVSTGGLNIATTNVTTRTDAEFAQQQIRSAVETISASRADLGGNLSRMEKTISAINVAIENTEAARSRLLDADIAKEVTTLTSQQVLLEAGTAVLAQANARPQTLLRLLDN